MRFEQPPQLVACQVPDDKTLGVTSTSALEMEPDYADAHFNLAGVLGKAGQPDAAALHWRRYLELDLGSPWAQIARSHLEEPTPPPDLPDDDGDEKPEAGA